MLRGLVHVDDLVDTRHDRMPFEPWCGHAAKRHVTFCLRIPTRCTSECYRPGTAGPDRGRTTRQRPPPAVRPLAGRR
ncbi:hypothetical protein SCATT_p16030 (plasmid) [Streptantibioticus cattleyicolor NRRL 8057 = DSM 46488]|uniref:Uncharacterized protein n=1 Tax=Streptantibioticus cattleyicolor (strain ATCC 35852 / DSM 46488 / JCM 4925 / NBRC 14057 / NRRL 8057) TaxID=1003195 RepID=G8XHF8_STREN|nr:hypothetical protein SCATT_p16030 [Streptantibioticus cattleyicolor NRRL 8057 = DSM 46488]